MACFEIKLGSDCHNYAGQEYDNLVLSVCNHTKRCFGFDMSTILKLVILLCVSFLIRYIYIYTNINNFRMWHYSLSYIVRFLYGESSIMPDNG